MLDLARTSIPVARTAAANRSSSAARLEMMLPVRGPDLALLFLADARLWRTGDRRKRTSACGEESKDSGVWWLQPARVRFTTGPRHSPSEDRIMQLLHLPTALLVSAIAWASTSLAEGPVNASQPAAYFVYENAVTGFVFTLNAVQNTGDLYIHMHGPWNRAWIGCGIGTRMDDSLMMISYAAANGTGVTTSPRFATGHSEPSWISSDYIEKIYDDTYAPNANTVKRAGFGNMIAHFICRNCSSIVDIDFTSTKQPFIWAMGPVQDMLDDRQDAPLVRHEIFGRFTMDMTKATSNDTGRVPAPNLWTQQAVADDNTFGQEWASDPFDVQHDSDRAVPAHAAMMVIAFVLIFPLGAVLLRAVKSVMVHLVTQLIGCVFVIAGFGTAVWISTEYNRTKHFQDPHQIIGLLICAFLLIQLGLGLAHHLIFKKTEKPTILGKIHMFLGPAILLLAIVNGGLGFRLAGERERNIVIYAVVVGVVTLVFLGFRTWLHFLSAPRRYRPESEEIDPYAAVDFYAAQKSPFAVDENGALKSPFFPPSMYAPTTPHYGPESPYSFSDNRGYEMEMSRHDASYFPAAVTPGEVYVPIPKAYYDDGRA
nr:hypothetical protein CFP56_73416 [Quercus suber]